MEKDKGNNRVMKPGVYETLISRNLEQSMEASKAEGLECLLEKIDNEESAEMLTSYVAGIVGNKLKDINKENLDERMALVNKIIRAMEDDDSENYLDEENEEFLSAVVDKPTMASLRATKQEIIRPRSGFRVSTLFTGGSTKINMLSELERDIASADQICMIVSFLRMSGINMIYDELKKFCSKKGHSLRIITTTYCGITEGKAVDKLASLPNTEVRISYNTEIERLHAKSYIFLRESGFDSAYIGSSNLSKSAQTTGLEWNIRVTNVENPHIIKTAMANFNKYWESRDFEDYREGGIEKFNAERAKNKSGRGNGGEIDYSRLQQYSILPHQKEILSKLATVRNNGLKKNLIVAATGTGKTVLCAFDYRNFLNNRKEPARILFIAHRVEILKQALHTFRGVLCDPNFGELWCGKERPQGHLDQLFISVQTANSNLDVLQDLGADYYDYVVFDEAHHIEASTYQRILNFFQPEYLIGLTATPERADGKSLLPDFGNRISAEIRLPEALEQHLLTPFQYLCISDADSVNLDDASLWAGGKYIDSELAKRLSTGQRVQVVVKALKEYLADEQNVKALCFCVNQRHADFMVEELREYGFKADSLYGSTPMDRRRELNMALRRGDINYLCVVDVFNEGVDIPEVDTVLFLRPTESLTIFLQQLGRGLRLSPGKEYLTVLDFVAQANKNYDFGSRFRALLTKSDVNIEKQCREGFTLLPSGCFIHMEEKARTYILDNIRGAIFNINRLTKELALRPKTTTLLQFVESIGQDVRLIYKGENCWTSLKRAAGKCQYEDDDFTKIFSKAMGRFLHFNSSRFIEFLQRYLNNGCRCDDVEEEEPWRVMLYYALYNTKLKNTPFRTIEEALGKLAEYDLFVEELKEIIEYISANLDTETVQLNTTSPLLSDLPSGLDLYGCYTREEIFALFGRQTADKKMQGSAAGVFAFDDRTEAFFVTLNKSDKDFSPSTMYDDYFVSDTQFHWQSQSSESHHNRGSRYVQQQSNQKRFLLFVREDKKDAFGNTSPYYCMGAVDYISSHGNLPMNIDWHLQQPALPKFLKII